MKKWLTLICVRKTCLCRNEMSIRVKWLAMCYAGNFLLWLYLLMNIHDASTISLSCGTDNIIEVVEGAVTTVTCNGLSVDHVVQWKVTTTGNPIGEIIGTCSNTSTTPNNCEISLPVTGMNLSRTSDSESVLTIPADVVNARNWHNGTLLCGISESDVKQCNIDFVYTPEGSCSIQPNKHTLPWLLSGECNITKVFSSRGRYTCQWKFDDTALGNSVPMVTQPFPSGERYVSGTCKLPGNVSMSDHQGQYRVSLTPLKVIAATGINEVRKPIEATINCSPIPHVPENTNVSCNCTTPSVGIPGGRLKLSKIQADISRVIKYGDYDRTILSNVSQFVRLSDHNVTRLKCDVEWITDVTGPSILVSVGYLHSVVLKINSSLSVAVDENVTFDCKAVGWPTPSLRLVNIDNNTVISSSLSPLFFTLFSAQCQDTATYSCIASNAMGSDLTTKAKLEVICNPQNNARAIGIGIGVTFVVIIIVVSLTSFIYLRRHNWKIPFTEKTLENPCKCWTSISNLQRENQTPSNKTEHTTSDSYDELRKSRMGVTLSYEDLQKYENVSFEAKPRSDSVYEDTDTPAAYHIYSNTLFQINSV